MTFAPTTIRWEMPEKKTPSELVRFSECIMELRKSWNKKKFICSRALFDVELRERKNDISYKIFCCCVRESETSLWIKLIFDNFSKG